MRRCAVVLVTMILAGCGVPIGGFVKPPSSSTGDVAGATVSAVGQNAFLPALDLAPTITTGEQTGSATADDSAHRGIAGTSLAGEPFSLVLTAGAGVQIIAAGPERSDIVLTFTLGGTTQRVDGDPLSPDLSVESLVLSTDVATAVTFRVRDFTGDEVTGLVRWFAFLLPSSQGRVSSPGADVGPAGTIALPGEFEFDADSRGRRFEVIAVGGTGTDLRLEAQIGDRAYSVDADPQRPTLNIEGFTLEVDDPAAVRVAVDGGGSGDVRWAVVPLPEADVRAAPATAD